MEKDKFTSREKPDSCVLTDQYLTQAVFKLINICLSTVQNGKLSLLLPNQSGD